MMARQRTTANEVVDVPRATLSIRNGGVVIDDPTSPWIIKAWVSRQRTTPNQPILRRLQLEARPGIDLASTRISRLPLRQIRRIAASMTAAADADHPNETWYRMLATPRTRGDDEAHWERVLAVYEWAKTTGRVGGGARAVADLWGVSLRPTAYRWIAQARQHKPGDDLT